MDRSIWKVGGFSQKASGIRVKYKRESWGGNDIHKSSQTLQVASETLEAWGGKDKKPLTRAAMQKVRSG